MNVLLALGPLFLPIPCSSQPASSKDIAYWYYDIYDPFFETRRSTSTGDVLVFTRRPRARPQAFLKSKPAGTRRAFVVGGSVAQQYDSAPLWAAGNPTLADALGRGAEVVNCGMGGYDVFRDSLVFGEVLEYSPDLVVLMSGNNESGYASGGPGRLTEFSRKLRRRLGLGVPSVFLQLDARKGRPDYGSMVRGFEAALRSMVRRAKAKNVRVVLCTLPRPLDLPPTPPAPLPLGERDFFDAWSSLERGDLDAAAAGLEAYGRRKPADPAGPFWLARCLERQGKPAEARRAFRRAQERDLSRISEINQAIRAAAREEGASLADLDLAFEGLCRGTRVQRLPKGHGAVPHPRYGAGNLWLFSDSMHWFRFADPFVSEVIAGRVPPAEVRISAAELDETFSQRLLSAVWFSQADSERFNEQAVALLERLHEENAARLERLVTTESGLRETVSGNAWSRSQAGDFDRRWAAGLAHLAEMLRRRGSREKAVRWFAKALELRPGLSVARVQLALLEGGRTAGQLLAYDPDLAKRFPELCFRAERSTALKAALPEGSCPPSEKSGN